MFKPIVLFRSEWTNTSHHWVKFFEIDICSYFSFTNFYFSRATDIAAMDTNGLSDPFVEIALHKDLVLKTKVINKTVNPMWNETFTLYIDDRSILANIHVGVICILWV